MEVIITNPLGSSVNMFEEGYQKFPSDALILLMKMFIFAWI